MAITTGNDYEDLVKWVQIIAYDAALEQIAALQRGECNEADLTDPTGWADVIGEAVATGFEQVLVNHYGED